MRASTGLRHHGYAIGLVAGIAAAFLGMAAYDPTPKPMPTEEWVAWISEGARNMESAVRVMREEDRLRSARLDREINESRNR